MTIATRNHLISAFAAVFCAFITIGFSVAPAVMSTSGLAA
jgi:hypothetical protein